MTANFKKIQRVKYILKELMNTEFKFNTKNKISD